MVLLQTRIPAVAQFGKDHEIGPTPIVQGLIERIQPFKIECYRRTQAHAHFPKGRRILPLNPGDSRTPATAAIRVRRIENTARWQTKTSAFRKAKLVQFQGLFAPLTH